MLIILLLYSHTIHTIAFSTAWDVFEFVKGSATLSESEREYRITTRWPLSNFSLLFVLIGGKDQRNEFASTMCEYHPLGLVYT